MSTTESIYISAQMAADRIGLSKRRVNQLVTEGELEGELIGNSNAIKLNSVKRYEAKRRRLCLCCDAEQTSADREAGKCTQCGRGL